MTSMQLSNTIEKIIRHKMTIEEAFRRYPGYEQQILNGLRAAGAAGTALQKLVTCIFVMQAAGVKEQLLADFVALRLDLQQSMEQLINTYSQLNITLGDLHEGGIESKILSNMATVIDTQRLSDYDKGIVVNLMETIKYTSKSYQDAIENSVDAMIKNGLGKLGLFNI